MQVVIPDKMYLAEKDRKELISLGATIAQDTTTDPKEMMFRVRNADILTAKFVDITREIIDAAPKLKYIVSAAAGYDSIDVTYASAKGIKVINCPTHHAAAVAEHTLALLFALLRHIKTANDIILEGGWDSPLLEGTEISGKQVGLIGHGNIGARVESLLAGIGAQISYVDSQSSASEVDRMISQSDVVIICAQLNDATRHLIDERRIAAMKSSAYLINISRGAIVDQVALMAALERKAIRGAGLDVFEYELSDGPATPPIKELAQMSNVIATPHIGYHTGEALVRLSDELLVNIRAILGGAPINVVNS